jgi:hypothetical protein
MIFYKVAYQYSLRKAIKHVFGVSQTLALCGGNHGIMAVKVAANGTAIEGVCVTSAANRHVICPVRPTLPTVTTSVVKVGELSR